MLIPKTIMVEMWKEGSWYIIKAVNLNVVTQGHTQKEAEANFREALLLHLEDPIVQKEIAYEMQKKKVIVEMSVRG